MRELATRIRGGSRACGAHQDLLQPLLRVLLHRGRSQLSLLLLFPGGPNEVGSATLRAVGLEAVSAAQGPLSPPYCPEPMVPSVRGHNRARALPRCGPLILPGRSSLAK